MPHEDSTGHEIQVGDRVRCRDGIYTIKAFGPPTGRCGTPTVEFVETYLGEDVPDEISVDLVLNSDPLVIAWDHEKLERDFDRPSLHSDVFADRVIGRLTALVDQHRSLEHPEDTGLGIREFKCMLCGYDFQTELQRLYPNQHIVHHQPQEPEEKRQWPIRIIESMWWSPMTPSQGIGAITVQVSEKEYRAYIGVYPSPCFETEEISARRIAQRGARLDEPVTLVLLPLADRLGFTYGRD